MLQYLVGLNQLSQNLNNFVLPYPMASMAMRLAALKQEKLLSDNLSDEQLDLIKECSELPDKELAETLEITLDTAGASRILVDASNSKVVIAAAKSN